MAADEVIAQGTLQLVVDVNQAQVEAAIEDMARGITNKLVRAAEGGETAFKKLGQAASAVAKTLGAVGAVGGAALVTLATRSIRAGAAFNILQQKARASLTTILGTASAANELLTAVIKLNSTSPFSQSSFIEATQQLIGFGVEAKQIVPILDAVQQAVAAIGGSEAEIARLSGAFAKVASFGKLSGDVLLTFKEQGIDAAGIIADEMGISVDEFTKKVQAGMFDATESIDLLTNALQNKFGGATENAAASIGTAMDRLSSRIRNIGADLTEAFISPFGGGIAVDIINNITKALDNLRKNVIPTLVPIINSVGEAVKKLSEGFVRFTETIKPEQVERVLEVFRFLLPLVVGLGTALAKTGSNLPFIGPLLGALHPVVLAFVALVAVVPQFRQVMLDLGSALQPLVEALLPLLENVFKSLIALLGGLIPVLGVVVTGIRFLVNALAPLINFVSGFGLLNAALALFAVRLALIVKLSGGFSQIIPKIGVALRGLATPLNVAIIGFTVLAARLADNQAKAKEFAAEFTKGIDTNNLEDVETAIKAINKAGLEAQATANKGLFSSGIFNVFLSDDARKAADNAKKLREELDRLQDIKGLKADLFAGVREAIPGKQSVEELETAVAALGIRFEDLTATNLPIVIERIQKEFGNMATAAIAAANALIALKTATFTEGIQHMAASLEASVQATNAVKDAENGLAAARASGATDAAEVANAERGVASARRAVEAASETLNELEQRRAELLADTAAGVREVRDAEIGLLRIRQSLLDLDQQEQEIQQDLEDLAIEGPDKLAAADRAILRAKLALNEALRAEKELLEGTNKEQVAALNLSGLTLDQVRAKLAAVRANLALQRSTTKDAKTQEEIADEALSKRLGVLDSEQALKDSTKERADIEIALGVQKREDEEKLAELALDREETLRRQGEQEKELRKLRSGDTAHARAILAVEEDIKDAKIAQSEAAQGVADAEGQVTAARATQAGLAERIAEAERILAIALLDERQRIAEINQDQAEINRILIARIGINKSLLLQDREQAKALIDAVLGPLPAGGRNSPAAFARAGALEQLLAILASGGDLIAFLRQLAKDAGITAPFAKGGLITSPTSALMGEGYKHEMVLPLHRGPQAVWDLLSKNIPKYPSLAAGVAQLSPPARRPAISMATSGRSSNLFGSGPLTERQGDEIIRLLKENGKSSITVEAPISVTTPIQDPNLVARKVARKVEDTIMRGLKK